MTIGEARTAYYAQYKKFSEAAYETAQQKKAAEEKMKTMPDGTDKDLFGKEAASLELRYNKLTEEAKKYLDYQSKIIDQECAYANMKSSEQNAEAMEEAYKDLSKIMMVARRLMKGDIVPPSDEMKLQEYDDKLYLSCKQMQIMAQVEKRREHESLWGDEETRDIEDPMEFADSQEISCADGPSLSASPADVTVETGSEG